MITVPDFASILASGFELRIRFRKSVLQKALSVKSVLQKALSVTLLICFLIQRWVDVFWY